METGKIAEVYRDLKFGVIAPDDGSPIIIFEKRTIEGLVWDNLRKSQKVAYLMAPVEPDESPLRAKLVTAASNAAALESDLGRGWTKGKVSAVFSDKGFGWIKPESEIVVIYSEANTTFFPPDSFSTFKVGDEVEYQDYAVLPSGRKASKMRRRAT